MPTTWRPRATCRPTHSGDSPHTKIASPWSQRLASGTGCFAIASNEQIVVHHRFPEPRQDFLCKIVTQCPSGQVTRVLLQRKALHCSAVVSELMMCAPQVPPHRGVGGAGVSSEHVAGDGHPAVGGGGPHSAPRGGQRQT